MAGLPPGILRVVRVVGVALVALAVAAVAVAVAVAVPVPVPVPVSIAVRAAVAAAPVADGLHIVASGRGLVRCAGAVGDLPLIVRPALPAAIAAGADLLGPG